MEAGNVGIMRGWAWRGNASAGTDFFPNCGHCQNGSPTPSSSARWNIQRSTLISCAEAFLAAFVTRPIARFRFQVVCSNPTTSHT